MNQRDLPSLRRERRVPRASRHCRDDRIVAAFFAFSRVGAAPLVVEELFEEEALALQHVREERDGGEERSEEDEHRGEGDERSVREGLPGAEPVGEHEEAGGNAERSDNGADRTEHAERAKVTERAEEDGGGAERVVRGTRVHPRLANRALTDAQRHFHDAEVFLDRVEEHFLRVREAAKEGEAERRVVRERPKSARDVREALPRCEAHDARDCRVSPALDPRHRGAEVGVQEAGAESDVGAAREKRCEQRRNVFRIELTVGVEVRDEVGAAAEGFADAGLERGADAAVGSVGDNGRPCGTRLVRCSVRRAVVHDNDLVVGRGEDGSERRPRAAGRVNAPYDVTDRRRFVVGRDQDDEFHEALVRAHDSSILSPVQRAAVRAALACVVVIGLSAPAAEAASVDAVGLFRGVFGRGPTAEERQYWELRLTDKPTAAELRGAMYYVKGLKKTQGDPVARTPKELAAYVPRAFREVFGREPDAKEKTYWADRVLCEDLATYKGLIAGLSFHKAKGLTVGKGTKADFCARAAAKQAKGGIRLNASLGFSGHAAGPLVRIGLLEIKKDGVKVSGAGKFFVRLPDGKKKIFAGPQDVVTTSWTEGVYLVRGPRKYAVELDAPPRFGGMDGKPLVLASQKEKPDGVPGSGPYNRYRGVFEVRVNERKSGLWVINELRTEDYLRGLAETTDASPAEFQKALAVAARTYVLYHSSLGGRQPGNGFIITNTANDQLYAGYDYETRVPDLQAQMKVTRGVLVTYDSKPIAALYFSQSDGKTRSGEEVWRSKRFPYLQAKKDPYGGKRLVGHGTGLSARGAIGFAREEDWNFRKILTYYYTGVKLERAY